MINSPCPHPTDPCYCPRVARRISCEPCGYPSGEALHTLEDLPSDLDPGCHPSPLALLRAELSGVSPVPPDCVMCGGTCVGQCTEGYCPEPSCGACTCADCRRMRDGSPCH